jgi:ELWxxDGT repeat protein
MHPLYTDINPSGVVISWGKAQSSSSSITAATLAVTSSERVKTVATVFTFAGGVNQGFANGTGTNAMFNSPRGVIVDDFGIVYVADTNNNRIRSISPEGIVNSIAGQESSGSDDGVGTDARFNQPWSLVVDSFKNLFVSDCNNNRVRKITYSGNVTTITGSSEGFVDGTLSEAKFNRPKGLVFNTFGKLFVADYGNNCIRLIDISGNNVSTFAFLFRPSGIAFDAISEVLYVTDELFSVSKISSSGNVESLNDFFNAPFGIIVTPARRLLVITYQRIYQTSLIGSGSTTVLVQGLYCYGIAIDKSGNFFLTDSSSIRRMSLSPFIPGPLPVCDSLWHSIALTFSGSTSGNVLMAYIDGKQIASTSASFVIPSTLSTNLRIGSNSDKSELFNGLISDVQIFNRSLSPIEVHTLSVPVMTNSLASAFFTPSASATQSSTPASSASAFATTTTTTTSSSSSTMSPAVSSSTTSSASSSPTSSISGTSSTTVSSTGTSSSTVTSSLTSSSSSSSTVSSSMSSTGTSSMTSSSSLSVSITGTSSSTTTQTASSSPTLSSSATATSSPTISASATATASASFSVTRTATTSPSSYDIGSIGPVMLLDIYPGSYSSFPSSMTVYKNKLYFTANDALNGNELWASDGTSAVTLLFKDINPGPSDSYPISLIVFNDKLYFTANDTHGVELWSTDGTNSGTSIVRDINPGFEGSNPYYLTVFNSKLYFRASDGLNGYELWCSDGTSLGTTMVKDINPALGNSYSLTLTVFNSKLYFAAIDGTSTSDDFELWSSDGTGLGTSKVGNINSGSIVFDGDSFTVYNSKMYFTVTDSAGNELWFTDGINVAMVKDINPGSASSRPSFLTVFNNKLYFAANDGSNGYELMTTDGIDVSMVKDINPGSASSSPFYLTVYKNKLYFNANYFTSGVELWCSDGTEQGTILVKDIYPGIGSSTPRHFKVFKNNLYFMATDGTYGNELFVSDGSLSGTFLVKDINTGIGGSSPQDLTVFNNKLYFSAIDVMNGYELWVMAAETPYSTSISTFTPLPSTTTSKTSSSTSTPSQTSCPTRSSTRTSTTSSTATSSKNDFSVTTQSCLSGCSSLLNTSSFYFSGSQSDGFPIYSTIVNPNGISFTTIPTTALVLSSGSYLSSPILPTLPTGSSPFTISSWVKCDASSYTDINPSGVVIAWGEAQLSTNNSLLTSATLAVTSIERGEASVTTLAGSGAQYTFDGTGASAGFNYPWGIAVDTFGYIYVADMNSNSIRKVTPLGQVVTIASGFSNPYGVAVNSLGTKVYVSSSNSVRVVLKNGELWNNYGPSSVLASGFNNPFGLAVDSFENVYVADVFNHRICKISSNGVVSTLAGSGTTPEDFENYGGHADGPGITARFARPYGVAVDTIGNVYVADTYNGKLRKITPSGEVSTLPGPGGWGITIDSLGNIYQADAGFHRIVVTTPLGQVKTLAGSGTSGFADGTGTNAIFNIPYGVAVDSSGETVFVSEFSNHRVRKILVPKFPGPLPVCDSIWHHIALTYSNTVSAYIDGAHFLSKAVIYNIKKSLEIATIRVFSNTYPAACPGGTFIHFAPSFLEIKLLTSSGHNIALSSAGAKASVDSHVDDRGDCGCLSQSSTRLTEISLYLIDGSTLTGWNGRGAYGGCVRCTCSTSPWARVDIASSNIGTISTIEILGGPSGNPGSSGANTLDETYNNVNNYFSIEALSNTGEVLQKVTMASLGGIKNTVTSTIKWTWSINSVLNTTLRIGWNGISTNSELFTGSIRDVRIFNTSLNQSDIHILRGITSGVSTSPTTSSSASQSVSPSSSSSSSGTASSSSSASSSRSPMATKTSQSSISSSRTSSTTSSVSVSATSTSSATTTTTTTTSPTSSTNNASILSVLSTPSAVISSTSLSLLCFSGTYSQTGSLPCVSCPSNTYSYTGATSCSSCSIGSILISSSLGCRLISSSNRGPIDTTFYLSGSQSEGISAFSTINNPNGISFLSNLNSFPTTALVLSSGSYLSSPLLPTLPTGSSPFTISSWVKCDASSYTDINPSGVVIAWGEAQLSTNNSLLTSATLAVTSSTKSTGISSLPGPLPVCDSTWHNIVLSFTKTTSLSQNRRRLSTTSSMGALTAYIDGSIFASSLVNLSISSSSSSTFRIGTNGLLNGELFSGSISDLRIFNRSINESEILSLRSITIIPSILPVESNPSSSSSSSLSFALIGGSIAALIFVIGGSFVLVNWIKRRKILIEESRKLKEETLAKDVSVEIVENDTINDFENNRSGWRITSLSSTPPSNISSTSISLASSRVTAYEDKREGALKEVLKTPTSSSLKVSTSIEGRNSNSQKKTSIDEVDDDLILATKREFPEDDEDDDALLPGAISKIKDGETQELIEEYNLQGLLNGTSEGEGGVMSSLLTSAGSALESLAVASVSIPLVGLALKGLSMLCNQVEAFSQSNLEAEKLLGRLTRLQTVVQKASLDVDFCNEHSGIFDYMVKTLNKAADKLEIISKRSKLGKFVFAQSDIEIMERVDRAIMMHLTELQAAMQSQTMNMVKALHDGFVERSTKNEEEVKSAPLPPFSMRFKQSDIIFDPPLEKQLLTAPRGSFGVVVFGIWKAHNLPCAVKLISSRTATGVVAVSMMSWLSEAELMRRLREHLNSVTKQTPQNICTLFGIGAIESKTGEVTQYMVVMERLEGSLRDKLDSYLKKKRHPPLLQALTWIRDVAMGINECHDANVVHSDLKAANALLSKKNDAKLCDLGAGRVTRDMTATSSMINSTGGGIIRGSLPWLSSELLEDQSLQPSKASDVYAWACVCWEILSCRIPYHDDEGVLAIDLNKLKNLSAIVNGKLRPDLSALRADAPSSIVNIMQKAWDPEPRDRPQIGEILETLQSALASFKETKQSNSRRAAEAAAADLRSSTLLTQASKVEEEDAKKAVEDLKSLTKSLEEARALRISEIKKKHDDMAAKMRIDLELEEKRLDEEARREMTLEMEKNEIMLTQRKAKWVDEVNEKKEERLRNSHMLDEKDRARIVAEFELENREVEKRVEASRIEQTTKLEARLKERRDAKTRAAQKALLKLDLESLEAVENEEKKNIHDFLLD